MAITAVNKAEMKTPGTKMDKIVEYRSHNVCVYLLRVDFE